MLYKKALTGTLAGLALLSLAACGGGGLFSRGDSDGAVPTINESRSREGSSFFDLFESRDNPNVTLEVNKYIWNASLETLNFLPIEQADPFQGLIRTGFGTPPGGGTAYQATILVTDPALDARSLSLSLRTRSGAVDPDTVRLVEDAILTRARQIRIEELSF